MRFDRARPHLERLAGALGRDFRSMTLAAGLDPATDWCHANLAGIDFGDDDLEGFRFHGSRLHGADFRRARGLAPDMFLGADWDETTRFPKALGMPTGPWRPPLDPLARWREPLPGLPKKAWPDMVTIPAGFFLMGAPQGEEESREDERPQRRVTIPRPFALGRTAVTFAMWDAAVAAGFVPPEGAERPDGAGWGRDSRPVINVSWHDAQAYCVWLNHRLGLRSGTYRLPSEAEWEYACRAGTVTPFSFGKRISWEQANFDARGPRHDRAGRKARYRGHTVEVGTLPPNPWGLHEMHGNVWEWVVDADGPYPANATSSGPLVHATSDERVLRGGSWRMIPRNLRSTVRSRFMPSGRGDDSGFRVARTLL